MGWARCVLTRDWSHLPSSGWTPRGHQRLHDLSSQNRWIYQTDQKIENKSDVQTRQTELSNGPKEQEKKITFGSKHYFCRLAKSSQFSLAKNQPPMFLN